MASYLEVHTTACTGSKATWKQSTIFIDLKGSFDRTHSIVILAELSKLIQAKMLHLKDYLTDRQVAVYFEGVYSKWWCMELGIFSVTLFNIPVNIITEMKTQEVLTTVYANDTVFQAKG